MIFRFKKLTDFVTSIEKRKKKIEISKSIRDNLQGKYDILDKFQNKILHWKSRIDRLLCRYMDDCKGPPYDGLV